MNFSEMTADELVDVLPDSEDNRWELKSADFLDPKQRGEFKKELGKQVSAFSNTGGGNLVFGIGTTKNLEPCPEFVGRQPMKDYLSAMVEQSVDSPTSSYSVFRLPLKSDPATKAIYVILIKDSPLAPHQAKEERQYYWRIDGHSKAAPHFHLELLRSRFTKSFLEVRFRDWNVNSVSKHNRTITIHFSLTFDIENVSSVQAREWCCNIKSLNPRNNWLIDGDSLTRGHNVYHTVKRSLLPLDRLFLGFGFKAITDDLHDFEEEFAALQLQVLPITSDGIGSAIVHSWGSDLGQHNAVEKLRVLLEPYALR